MGPIPNLIRWKSRNYSSQHNKANPSDGKWKKAKPYLQWMWGIVTWNVNRFPGLTFGYCLWQHHKFAVPIMTEFSVWKWLFVYFKSNNTHFGSSQWHESDEEEFNSDIYSNVMANAKNVNNLNCILPFLLYIAWPCTWSLDIFNDKKTKKKKNGITIRKRRMWMNRKYRRKWLKTFIQKHLYFSRSENEDKAGRWKTKTTVFSSRVQVAWCVYNVTQKKGNVSYGARTKVEKKKSKIKQR